VKSSPFIVGEACISGFLYVERGSGQRGAAHSWICDEGSSSLRESNCWLGTWINPDTGDCYLDMTALYFCLEDAKREAIALSKRAQRKIVALYDFQHGRSLYLWDERKHAGSWPLAMQEPLEPLSREEEAGGNISRFHTF